MTRSQLALDLPTAMTRRFYAAAFRGLATVMLGLALSSMTQAANGADPSAGQNDNRAGTGLL